MSQNHTYEDVHEKLDSVKIKGCIRDVVNNLRHLVKSTSGNALDQSPLISALSEEGSISGIAGTQIN